ncbi:platelet glycoprotein VI-like [Manis pentadactyla]|uniref:platelet glycoprotein VI-like n=1 Tax=Manis pentadactyla TaxID=143292 RepID=UPI00255CA8AA|nr:platelet glycoprotein VI-like [Manis pentadactyla]
MARAHGWIESTGVRGGQSHRDHRDRSGPHRCSYKSRGCWSRLSEPLKLVTTGAFDKPSLSCAPGTVVPQGDDMELRCFSKATFEILTLTKEGILPTQNRSSSPKGSERQATFLLKRSSSAHGGTNRCYGAFHNHPFVWSHPSDPFQLVVKGPWSSGIWIEEV